ncbi:hypothetical protein [Latilactobacillus sakei]|uniref:hypothetical protein n=1 Tax=Latilactobacillus sakei TaxID=1599 RepID=UPI003F52EE51
MNEKPSFCPYCGVKTVADSDSCLNCGKLLVNKKRQAIDINGLWPDKAKLVALKEFLISNFELAHVCYLLIFIAGLISAKWGFILLLVGLISFYYLSLKNEQQDLAWNRRLKAIPANISQYKQAKNNKAETKQYSAHIEDQAPQNESLKVTVQESDAPKAVKIPKIRETAMEPKVLKVSKNTTNAKPVIRMGIVETLVIISAVASLIGVLSSGFIQITDGSLYVLVGKASEAARKLEAVQSYVSDSTSNYSGIIQLVAGLLIALPVLIIVLQLLRNRVAYIVAFLASVVELGFFIYCGNYISSLMGSYSGDFFELIVNNQSHILGFPAYALLVGVIGMCIFTFCEMFKPAH